LHLHDTGFFLGLYDPSLCTAFASAKNKINHVSPYWVKWVKFAMGGYSQNKCDFFNAYMFKKDGVALGTYSVLFAEEYEASEAAYFPGWVSGEY
jgi:hypothetical protein